MLMLRLSSSHAYYSYYIVTMKAVKLSTITRLILGILLVFAVSNAKAWDWTDYLSEPTNFATKTLTMDEVADLRVRDIKRRLTRRHGYGADEVAKILDKKELIQILSFEEHKLRQKELEGVKRNLFWKGIFTAVLVGLLTLFWPLLRHLFEVAHVNFVVYTDRKWYEAKRCWDYKSVLGCIGVMLMGTIDVLQLWMTVSILLGWVMTSKYFFPMPSLPIRPAAMMGGPVSKGPLAGYGLNIAPMAIGWVFRFGHGKIEAWVGRVLSRAHQRQRKEEKRKQRENETPEERSARKAAKRAAKAAAGQSQSVPQNERVQQKWDPRISSEPAPIQPLAPEEMKQAAAEAAERRKASMETNTEFDELD